jgi:hypothetical protein
MKKKQQQNPPSTLDYLESNPPAVRCLCCKVIFLNPKTFVEHLSDNRCTLATPYKMDTHV